MNFSNIAALVLVLAVAHGETQAVVTKGQRAFELNSVAKEE